MTFGINKKELNSFIKNINKGLNKEKKEFNFKDNNLEIIIINNKNNKENEDNKNLIDFIIKDKEKDKEDKKEF